MKRLPFIFTLLAVIALSASIVYWVMELYQPKQRPMAPVAATRLAEPSPDAAATLFGGQASSVVVSNYKLTGVIASGREGVAILVADGQPPKALQVGREIVSGVMLKEVWPRYVMLSEGGVLKRIDLATDTTGGGAAGLAPPTADQFGQQQQMQQQQMQPPPAPVPDGTSVPVPSNQPMEVPQPQALPPGVPPPPPPAQMPQPTRSFSNGQGDAPTQ